MSNIYFCKKNISTYVCFSFNLSLTYIPLSAHLPSTQCLDFHSDIHPCAEQTVYSRGLRTQLCLWLWGVVGPRIIPFLLTPQNSGQTQPGTASGTSLSSSQGQQELREGSLGSSGERGFLALREHSPHEAPSLTLELVVVRCKAWCCYSHFYHK